MRHSMPEWIYHTMTFISDNDLIFDVLEALKLYCHTKYAWFVDCNKRMAGSETCVFDRIGINGKYTQSKCLVSPWYVTNIYHEYVIFVDFIQLNDAYIGFDKKNT